MSPFVRTMLRAAAVAALCLAPAAVAQPAGCGDAGLPDGGCPSPECTNGTCGPPNQTGCRDGGIFVVYPDGGGWACLPPDAGAGSGDAGTGPSDAGSPPTDGGARELGTAGGPVGSAFGCTVAMGPARWLAGLGVLGLLWRRRRGRRRACDSR